MNRRQFLSLAPAFASLGLANLARADIADRKLLVLVYLKGGNDAYNTVVPYSNGQYRQLRPSISIARDQVLQFSETHGFHPALKPLFATWDAREMALMQGIGLEQVQDQHFRDVEMQFTASAPDEYLRDGWLTRALPRLQPGHGSLHALAFGDLDIREADPMGPFRGDRLAVINVQHPGDWLATFKMGETAHIATSAGRPLARAFSQNGHAELRTEFPLDEFGQSMKATVLLAAAGLAPPVIHITLNAETGDHHHAFDTHWKQLEYHGAALKRLAEGLAALRNGMREIGLWNNTLVATYDEFGRSPKENPEGGTHHGWASVQFVLGGKVKGGAHGVPLPVIDVFSIGGPKPIIDYRSLYTTIIENWWGNSASGVFARGFKPLDLLKT
jgi:uncharacterized protein (DUF1501 family)